MLNCKFQNDEYTKTQNIDIFQLSTWWNAFGVFSCENGNIPQFNIRPYSKFGVLELWRSTPTARDDKWKIGFYTRDGRSERVERLELELKRTKNNNSFGFAFGAFNQFQIENILNLSAKTLSENPGKIVWNEEKKKLQRPCKRKRKLRRKKNSERNSERWKFALLKQNQKKNEKKKKFGIFSVDCGCGDTCGVYETQTQRPTQYRLNVFSFSSAFSTLVVWLPFIGTMEVDSKMWTQKRK